MRAIIYERAGPAREVLRLEQLPTPEPGPGDVRIRVVASGINPTDVKSRGGAPGRSLAFPRIVPHTDGAGIIDAVGADVPRSRIGERVWTFRGEADVQFGTAAEFACVPSARAIPLPANADFALGAAIGIPAMTAWHAVMCGSPLEGRTVLVTGGAGNVGRLAIQIAHRHGARVIATVRGAERAHLATSAGAFAVIDPREENAALSRIMEFTGGAGADLVVDVDTSGNAMMLPRVVANGGTISSYGSGRNSAEFPIRDLRQRNATVRFITIYRAGAARLAEIAAGVNGLVAAGALDVLVGRRYPLAECAVAHEAVEAGQFGKVILEPQS